MVSGVLQHQPFFRQLDTNAMGGGVFGGSLISEGSMKFGGITMFLGFSFVIYNTA